MELKWNRFENGEEDGPRDDWEEEAARIFLKYWPVYVLKEM